MTEKQDRRSLGREGEARAALYLEKQGMRIWERNFACRQGEIDVIGFHKGCLVFVLLKYRRDEKRGTPESAVTLQKMEKICRSADYFRYLHHYGEERPFRYDVVAVSGDEIRWYENAFEHRERGEGRYGCGRLDRW